MTVHPDAVGGPDNGKPRPKKEMHPDGTVPGGPRPTEMHPDGAQPGGPRPAEMHPDGAPSEPATIPVPEK